MDGSRNDVTRDTSIETVSGNLSHKSQRLFLRVCFKMSRHFVG
jgi:hypothetical protein